MVNPLVGAVVVKAELNESAKSFKLLRRQSEPKAKAYYDEVGPKMLGSL